MLLLRPTIVAVLVVLVAIGGCRRRGEEPDYARPLRPGEQALVEVAQDRWPAFRVDRAEEADLLRGIESSLRYLQTPTGRSKYPQAGVTHAQVVGGLERFREFLRSGLRGDDLEAALRRDFRVLRSVGWDGEGTVLFTGYYTPIFEASRVRTGRFQFPLYRRPQDLVQEPGSRTVAKRRLAEGGLVPYPPRAEIERSGMLAGTEVVWLPSAVDAYVIQVQGSAKLRLRDGSTMEIGWEGDTGHDYVSVALQLVEDGHIEEDALSLNSFRQFFRDHPELTTEYLHRNPRYVFFHEAPGGPFGSLGQPVIEDVSIATDKAIFPPGALCWVRTGSGDRHRPGQTAGFRLDHDAGGAIRAPGKCDLYMGEGLEAERRAGTQRHEGQLYYLVLR